jgi:septal ring factor EnvC (AmiA/AmiB activator)
MRQGRHAAKRRKKIRAAQAARVKGFLFSASEAAVAEAEAAAAAADEDQDDDDPEAVVKAKPGVTHNVLPPVMD